MVAYIAIIAVIAGLLVYALATNPKVSEAGRILYAAGCFAILFAFAQKMVSLF